MVLPQLQPPLRTVLLPSQTTRRMISNGQLTVFMWRFSSFNDRSKSFYNTSQHSPIRTHIRAAVARRHLLITIVHTLTHRWRSLLTHISPQVKLWINFHGFHIKCIHLMHSFNFPDVGLIKFYLLSYHIQNALLAQASHHQNCTYSHCIRTCAHTTIKLTQHNIRLL